MPQSRVIHNTADIFIPGKVKVASTRRMDRFLALALGRQLQERRAGNFRCIVAIAPERKKASEDPLLFRAFADLTAPLSSPFLASPFLGAEGRVVGAVVLDSLAAHVPQQRIFGTQTFRPRREIAYLSNLAVDESARGRGLGRSLAIEAERLAAKVRGCDCSTCRRPFSLPRTQELLFRSNAAATGVSTPRFTDAVSCLRGCCEQGSPGNSRSEQSSPGNSRHPARSGGAVASPFTWILATVPPSLCTKALATGTRQRSRSGTRTCWSDDS